MLEPEPTKRFRFIYSAEPDPQTSGSKSGSNWVQKVREPDHGQSRSLGTGLTSNTWFSELDENSGGGG